MTAAILCAICQCEVAPEDATETCPDCKARYHADCWAENTGCAIYGCKSVPATEGLQEMEVPASFWGQERKPCPACGQEIQAAALRCRHCGAMFDTRAPESRSDYRDRQRQERGRGALENSIRWAFILALIPVLSLVGGLWARSIRSREADALRRLPSLQGALVMLAMAVGIGQFLLLIFFIMLFIFFS